MRKEWNMTELVGRKTLLTLGVLAVLVAVAAWLAYT